MIDETLLEAEDKMEKAVAVAQEDFTTIRTGRANPAMFSKIVIDYYGTLTPLNQLASFAAPEARMMVINPYDKSSIDAVEKAIRDSDLGVNPASDGNVVRVVLPQLTEERRRDYIKLARAKAEEARIAIRSIRRNANQVLDKLVKDGEVGKDDVHRAEKQLDDATTLQVAEVDELLARKEDELLEV